MADNGPRFQANLQRGGIGLAEMRRMLEAFAVHGDIDRLREQALEENLLAKTSEHSVTAMLSAFNRRFVEQSDLPPSGLVAQAMVSRISDGAKTQVLFPYFLAGDPLAERCYRDLVLPRADSPDAALGKVEVRDHLAALGTDHPELAEWSDYMQLRWSGGFLTLLRRFGLMERHPSTRLRRLWLLPESFAFFWLWYWEQGGSYWEAVRRGSWPLLQIDERGMDELLAEGKLRGWWEYQRLAEMVQFEPRFNGPGGWIQSGLA